MKQVLIVDDSSTMRKRIAALLHESPLIRVVGEAGSGREAIETVEQTRPDTVILDIHLPDQSGITLLKRFKAAYPEMKVIMMTTLDDPRYRKACPEPGCGSFFEARPWNSNVSSTRLPKTRRTEKHCVPQLKEVPMETFNNILVVSRSTKNCVKVLRTGVALARKFGGATACPAHHPRSLQRQRMESSGALPGRGVQGHDCQGARETGSDHPYRKSPKAC